MAESLRTIIAGAIKDADKSFFNEDYGRQADAVVKALQGKGYVIVPARPSDELLEHINTNLPVGRLRPRELVEALYRLIVDGAARLERKG